MNIWLCGPKISAATRLSEVDWGKDFVLQDERFGYFEDAAKSYGVLRRWYLDKGMHEMAERFHDREKHLGGLLGP